MTTTKSIRKKTTQRMFYQALFTMVYALETNHRHHYILRSTIYLSILNWFISVSNDTFLNLHHSFNTILLLKNLYYAFL